MGLCNSKPSPEPEPEQKQNPITTLREELEQNPINDKPSSPSTVNGGNQPQKQQQEQEQEEQNQKEKKQKEEVESVKRSPFFPFYSPSPAHSLFSKKSSPAHSSNSTPRRFFKRPFPPPSPAKHIRAVLARRHGSVKPNSTSIPEGNESENVAGLDKSFGFSKNFENKYELGDEVGRGHFGFTCCAKFKKGELKGQQVAVKVIPKAKMTTAIAIEDVRREVKILRALTGHSNLVHFYDAYEDSENVYIVME